MEFALGGCRDIWGFDDVGGQIIFEVPWAMTQGNVGFLGKSEGKNGYSGVDQWRVGGLYGQWKAKMKLGLYLGYQKEIWTCIG